jgi:hypothetical protein
MHMSVSCVTVLLPPLLLLLLLLLPGWPCAQGAVHFSQPEGV